MNLAQKMKQLSQNTKDISEIDYVTQEIEHQAKNGNTYIKVDAHFLNSSGLLINFLMNEGFEIGYENDMVGIISWR